MHAYQSYWFNHAASTRVENHGPKVVVGDLVRVGGWTGPARMGEYEVAVVTADTLGDYTINDVVLPVPGTNTGAIACLLSIFCCYFCLFWFICSRICVRPCVGVGGGFVLILLPRRPLTCLALF